VITKNETPSTVSQRIKGFGLLIINIMQIFTAIATSLNSSPQSSTSSSKIGIVVGSALGGFAFILLLLATALLCRRYRRMDSIRMKNAIPTPRRIRLEDEDEIDLADPGITFSRLEHPLRTGSDLDLSSIMDDMMRQYVDESNDVNSRLLPDWQQRDSLSGPRFPSHSRDASLGSNNSDTPLLARTLQPNWQNRSRVPFAAGTSSARKAREAGQRTHNTSLEVPASSRSLMDMTSVAGSRLSSGDELAMRLQVEQPQEQAERSDGDPVQEIPPLYHTIVQDDREPLVSSGGDSGTHTSDDTLSVNIGEAI
jgi:hypothetical protein